MMMRWGFKSFVDTKQILSSQQGGNDAEDTQW